MTWTPAPVVLSHGETFGHLRVLHGAGKGKVQCGCSCGNSRFFVRVRALMRGEVKKCDRCTKGRR